MKNFLLLASALIVLAGCDKDNLQDPATREGGNMTISTSVGVDTKVILEETATGISVKWKAMDGVRIFDKGRDASSKFTLNGGENGSQSTFTGDDPREVGSTNDLAILYPYIGGLNASSLELSDINYKGQIQTETTGLNHLSNYIYLYGEIDGSSKLRHLSSLLSFEINNLPVGFVPSFLGTYGENRF